MIGRQGSAAVFASSPNGRPVRSSAFVGSDLYLGTTDGLSVIKNAVATACQGSCNGVLISDGFRGTEHVGLTSDGINRLYVAINGRGVCRCIISSRAMQLISDAGTDPTSGATFGLAFVGGHSNLLQLERLGNLWVGDDTSDGPFNFTGRIWYISASIQHPLIKEHVGRLTGNGVARQFSRYRHITEALASGITTRCPFLQPSQRA